MQQLPSGMAQHTPFVPQYAPAHSSLAWPSLVQRSPLYFLGTHVPRSQYALESHSPAPAHVAGQAAIHWFTAPVQYTSLASPQSFASVDRPHALSSSTRVVLHC